MAEWDEVVDAHARVVFGLAWRIVGRVHDAEDVAQETFREAFELASRGKVTDWRGCLCRIATFRAIDFVRRRKKHILLDAERASTGPAPADEFAARELRDRLQAALPELPRQAAAVFVLTCFEQRARDEVATMLGMSPQAVSVALFKARKQLQEILLDEPNRNEVCHESES